MSRPLPVVFLLLSGLLALLAGCTRRESPADAGTRSGTLLLGNLAEPQELDPQLISAYTDQNIAVALFEGLCALDERTSQPVPAAAEKWTVSPDGLTYTFHLRPAARWSNGDPLTAHDFVAAWRRILSPSLAAEYAYLLHPLKNAAALNAGQLTDFTALGADALDDHTLRVTLEQPIPYLPALTAQPAWFPINPRVLAQFGDLRQRLPAWTRPGNLVGNGPFTLAEWSPQSRLVVTKNPSYWDAASVRLERIIFFPTDSPEVEERNFRAGQVHVTYGLPTAKLETYRRDQPAALRLDPFLQAIFLRFNTTRPPFTDPRVRRALSLAIDRDAIAATVLRGAGTPARHFTPPASAGYTARATVPTDFAAARALLAAAGFPGGQGLPTLDLQVRNDEHQPRVAEVLQAQWQKELGVTLTLTPLEQKTWVQNQQTLAYTLSGAGWIGDFVDPVTFLDLFVSTGGNNWTGWADPAYDALIRQAAATPDPAARHELFQQAEARLLDQAPIAPVFFGTRAYLIAPAVRGWEPSLLGLHQYKKVFLQ
ncbi:Periplasmic oligopeptide-binding protein precursor [Lacunisphaera limnophila]|uniref:Periplasmic oligopeptide-binding protein n=1 Tax=Lacunisphaera limnophila TaxID=1838286 RepID=A0A1D8AV89_9BACT|nr:peptide ABC transporter substrate-binding protein [Lacunisphaera limnophila]AOS44810.1 Periplasmic oligopeptide-binding protein precursor [Lacunisphaera limnophila]